MLKNSKLKKYHIFSSSIFLYIIVIFKIKKINNTWKIRIKSNKKIFYFLYLF